MDLCPLYRIPLYRMVITPKIKIPIIPNGHYTEFGLMDTIFPITPKQKSHYTEYPLYRKYWLIGQFGVMGFGMIGFRYKWIRCNGTAIF